MVTHKQDPLAASFNERLDDSGVLDGGGTDGSSLVVSAVTVPPLEHVFALQSHLDPSGNEAATGPRFVDTEGEEQRHRPLVER